MCVYVTAVLPGGTDLESAKPKFEVHGFAFQRYANASVTEALSPGATLVLTTRGHCDCGTAIGSACATNPRPDPERHVARLKAKGWGDAKIARWMESRSRADESRAGGSREIAAWKSLFLDVLQDGGAPWIGLFFHFYDGQVSTERVAVKAAPSKSVDALVEGDFLTLTRDTFLIVARSRK